MADASEVKIHPSSVVEEGASLGSGVEIGPFCHVGADVVLGDEVRLVSHVAVAGDTHIGAKSRLFPFASIGHEPQDLKFKGEHVTLRIGERCTMREGVTINPGTAGDKSTTVIGNDCTFLANSHVAHDCTLGDRVIFSNNVMLAGHCTVGNNVIFGGGAAAHQFCRIGHDAFIGGLAGVEGDVIPYGMALGNRAKLSGLNIIGMKRQGVPRPAIHALRGAYKAIFAGQQPVQDVVAELRNTASEALVIELLDFLAEAKDRALCTPG